MKIRLTLACLGASLATSAVEADYLGLTVESYVGEGWVEHGFADLTAWRIYAEFSSPDEMLVAVFGSPANPMSLTSGDGVFRNDPVHDSLLYPCHYTQPPNTYWANQWDTYVTLDPAPCELNVISVSPGFAAEVNDLAANFKTINAAWFTVPGGPPGFILAGSDLRILLGQFVVAEGESISGTLNLQLAYGQQALDQPFQSPDPCPPDVNGDGTVDVLDLLAVLAAWGPCPGCGEDINGDEIVNVLDLLEILAAWGPCE